MRRWKYYSARETQESGRGLRQAVKMDWINASGNGWPLSSESQQHAFLPIRIDSR